MTIEYIKYYRYGVNTSHHQIEVPDDTLIVKLPWSKFGCLLEKYKDVKDPQDDMYCSDYYISFRINSDELENLKRNILETHELNIEYMFLKGDADTFLLMRLHSSEIATNVKFSTIDELNASLPIDSQFYCETSDNMLCTRQKIDEVIRNADKYTNEELIGKLEELNHITDAEILYYHPIRLTVDGFWTQIVGANKQFANNYPCMNDIIYHDIMDLDRLQESEFAWVHNKIKHFNLDMKDKYYQRISNVINQKQKNI